MDAGPTTDRRMAYQLIISRIAVRVVTAVYYLGNRYVIADLADAGIWADFLQNSRADRRPAGG